MRQGGGGYDGVSAPRVTRRCRLIANGDVAAIDPATIPGFGDVAPFLQNAPHYVVDGKHYGTPARLGRQHPDVPHRHGDPGADQLGRRLRPDRGGSRTRARSPPTTARSTSPTPRCTSRRTSPSSGITDPYELTQPQFDAAVELLKQQRPWVGKYWSSFADEIDNFTNGTTVVGTTWPYQVNTLAAAGVPVEPGRAHRGHDRLGRHLDAVDQGRSTRTACSSGWPGC